MSGGLSAVRRDWRSWLIVVVLAVAAFAAFVAPFPYDEQFREHPDAAPSRQFLLGTDDLGRDRLSRLLHGTQVSMLLAPAAALLATVLAGVIGGVAGFAGGKVERLVLAAADWFAAMPWLFLLLMVRAALPLNVEPRVSIAITFLLLAVLGWPAGARAIRAGLRSVRESEYCLAARARGCSASRLLLVHVLPNLKPVLVAQFWVSVPLFIIAEANLGILGLGIAEPLPSWGNLLFEMARQQQFVVAKPWLLAPAFAVAGTLLIVQLLLMGKQSERIEGK